MYNYTKLKIIIFINYQLIYFCMHVNEYHVFKIKVL
jgi:hypothetical protein